LAWTFFIALRFFNFLINVCSCEILIGNLVFLISLIAYAIRNISDRELDKNRRFQKT